MAELDIEKLKQSTKDIDNPTIGMDSHRSAVASFIAQRYAIITALEDRDRLRAAALAVIESYWTETDDGTMAALRAALEGRDG